jgi:radical SAM protein with 4Fe4S-binding SPASM domain
MEENIDELYDLVKFLHGLGVVNFGFTLEMFVTPEEIALSKKFLGYQDLPLALEMQNEAKYKFSLEKLKQTIDKVRAIKGINLVIQPGVFSDFPEEFYNGTLREKTDLVCKNMFIGRVNAQGDVIFCPFIKKSFGNLLKESFEEIWNSEEFKQFRKKLAKNNLVPICSKCCRLSVKAQASGSSKN